MFYWRVTVPPLDMLGPPSGGVLALLLASFVFLTALVFAARPFYRPHLGYGSPPSATRSELLAFACIPLFIALAGKVDLVAMLTSINHEKLNVLQIESFFHTDGWWRHPLEFLRRLISNTGPRSMYFSAFRGYRCWTTIHSPSCPLHVARKGGMVASHWFS